MGSAKKAEDSAVWKSVHQPHTFSRGGRESEFGRSCQNISLIRCRQEPFSHQTCHAPISANIAQNGRVNSEEHRPIVVTHRVAHGRVPTALDAHVYFCTCQIV